MSEFAPDSYPTYSTVAPAWAIACNLPGSPSEQNNKEWCIVLFNEGVPEFVVATMAVEHPGLLRPLVDEMNRQARLVKSVAKKAKRDLVAAVEMELKKENISPSDVRSTGACTDSKSVGYDSVRMDGCYWKRFVRAFRSTLDTLGL